jgi:dTDP-4-dehydrorhamnose reductase
MKVLVLGANGMLGHAVTEELSKDFEVIPVTRKEVPIGFDFEPRVLDPYAADYVINCVGVTIPFSQKDPAKTVYVNAVFPHILADWYKDRLIHITTDCVYSGTDGKGPYTEFATTSAQNLYGLSKSLGEPKDAITIRTSIIGRETHGFTGLLEWFLREANSKGIVEGYTQHLWNGVTTKEFGKICRKLMNCNHPAGLYHVHSTDILKYEMLLAFKKKYKLDCVIQPVDGSVCDRRLRTIHSLCESLDIPSFEEMIEEM